MKKLILFLIVSITVLGTIISCKKDPIKFTIKGNITNNTSNSPLNGANVILTSYEAGGGSVKQIANITTGSDGSYSIVFDRERDEKFELNITKNGHFSIDKTIFFSDLSSENENVYNFTTTEQSWVKFNISSSSSVTDTDELKIQKTRGKTNCSACCPIGFTSYYGQTNISVLCPNDANTYHSFIYWLPGTSTAVYDSVYCTPQDTIEYNINY